MVMLKHLKPRGEIAGVILDVITGRLKGRTKHGGCEFCDELFSYMPSPHYKHGDV